MKEIIVAVAGQPNSGKSTIFNMLTGARQHVANYPGVTVEKKIGRYTYKGDTVVLVDLPGTYSLTSYSQEEKIARDFLLHEKPAVVLNIVDAANLERNLYLTFQLQEMGIPMVVALNMMDVAKDRGLSINTNTVNEFLGVAVIPTVGKKNRGAGDIKDAIFGTYRGDCVQATACVGCAACSGATQKKRPFKIDYGNDLESAIASLEAKILEDPRISSLYSPRWLAVKLMENDSEARRLVKKGGDR